MTLVHHYLKTYKYSQRKKQSQIQKPTKFLTLHLSVAINQ